MIDGLTLLASLVRGAEFPHWQLVRKVCSILGSREVRSLPRVTGVRIITGMHSALPVGQVPVFIQSLKSSHETGILLTHISDEGHGPRAVTAKPNGNPGHLTSLRPSSAASEKLKPGAVWLW